MQNIKYSITETQRVTSFDFPIRPLIKIFVFFHNKKLQPKKKTNKKNKQTTKNISLQKLSPFLTEEASNKFVLRNESTLANNMEPIPEPANGSPLPPTFSKSNMSTTTCFHCWNPAFKVLLKNRLKNWLALLLKLMLI